MLCDLTASAEGLIGLLRDSGMRSLLGFLTSTGSSASPAPRLARRPLRSRGCPTGSGGSGTSSSASTRFSSPSESAIAATGTSAHSASTSATSPSSTSAISTSCASSMSSSLSPSSCSPGGGFTDLIKDGLMALMLVMPARQKASHLAALLAHYSLRPAARRAYRGDNSHHHRA